MKSSLLEIQNQSKIIATIGPACASYDALSSLVDAGVKVFRLNFSHGTHEYHDKMINLVKRLNRKIGCNVAILMDTKGPEIRTADLHTTIQLKKNQSLILTTERVEYEQSGKLGVSYDTFVDDVEVGQKVLIDNGVINLLVKEKSKTDVICTVLDGGIIGSRRHINIPGQDVSLDSITQKDWEDIDFGIKNGVDYVALSFIRRADDIRLVRDYLKKQQSNMSIIAKIESHEATKNLEAIIHESDMIMVARGDLGAEIPFEDVPRIQREIIEMCHQRRTPVIVATHMLESMIHNPIPTRAEASDISLAVWQRADAVMLSGETAGGAWPKKSVEVMNSVVRATEVQLRATKIPLDLPVQNQRENIVRAAISCLRHDKGIRSIFVVTRSGHMAKLTSALRPNVPIIAFTNEPPTRRKIQLYWGVTAYRIYFSSVPQTTIQRAQEHFLNRFPQWKGSTYILISDFLVDNTFVPTLQIRVL